MLKTDDAWAQDQVCQVQYHFLPPSRRWVSQQSLYRTCHCELEHLVLDARTYWSEKPGENEQDFSLDSNPPPKKIDIVWRQGDTTITPYCMLFLTIVSIHNNPHVLSENMFFNIWIPSHRLWTHKWFLWLWKRKRKLM